MLKHDYSNPAAQYSKIYIMKATNAFGVVKNELYDLIETAMLTVTTYYVYIYYCECFRNNYFH